MKITVTAKVDEDVAAEAEKLAGRLGITRSQLVAWAVEKGVEEVQARLSHLEAAGTITLPGIPPEVTAS